MKIRGGISMEEKLKVYARQVGRKSTLNLLRKTGKVPAVLYGSEIKSTKEVYVEEAILRQFLARHNHSALFEIQLDDQELYTVKLNEIQKDPLSKKITHVDIYQINKNKPIQTTIPIHLYGEKEVDKKGGILQLQLRELEVRGLPSEIPPYLTVDVSNLEIGDTVHVKDLTLPASLDVQHQDQEIVITILQVAEEELEPHTMEPEHEPVIVGAKNGPGIDAAK